MCIGHTCTYDDVHLCICMYVVSIYIHVHKEFSRRTVLHSKRVDFEHGVISAVFPSHTCNYIVLFW